MWDEHRDASSIGFVRFPVKLAEILFLESDRDKDVCRHSRGECEMGESHRRHGPKRRQPTEIQRMSHEAIKARRGKWQRGVGTPAEIKPRLPQAEQIKMIDQ